MWNLAVNYHEQDVTNAEFLRTYRSDDFPGRQLVKRLEDEKSSKQSWTRSKVVPVRKGTCDNKPISLMHFEDIYGFRGPDPRVYFLNPWEFFMLWQVEKLFPPSEKPKGLEKTRWIPGAPHTDKKGRSLPGVHYVVQEEAEGPNFVLFPKHLFSIIANVTTKLEAAGPKKVS